MTGKLKIMFCVVVLTAFCSCKEKVELELPYEEEKVVHILGDMHFAKSAAMVENEEVRDSMQKVYEEQVLKVHNITQDDYQSLKTILESDLNLYYAIEKKVNKHLKEVQNEKK